MDQNGALTDTLCASSKIESNVATGSKSPQVA
jgi:hypothetical protein